MDKCMLGGRATGNGSMHLPFLESPRKPPGDPDQLAPQPLNLHDSRQRSPPRTPPSPTPDIHNYNSADAKHKVAMDLRTPGDSQETPRKPQSHFRWDVTIRSEGLAPDSPLPDCELPAQTAKRRRRGSANWFSEASTTKPSQTTHAIAPRPPPGPVPEMTNADFHRP